MQLHTLARAARLVAPALLIAASGGAHALECPSGQWLAEYYPNIKLAGAPVLTRCETGPIDYYWMTDSPDPRLPVDAFSARWTATLPFSAGNAKITTYTDDGVRVFVDGKRVINNWTRHGITEDTAKVKLAAGMHTVRMEYFEAGGEGLAQLFIQGAAPAEPPPPPPPPPRIAAFTAQPGTIDAGGTSILTWNAENATACAATGGWSGAQSPGGSASVKPAATTTYGLTCRNPAGNEASASATVTVRAKQPDPQDPPPQGDGLNATVTPAGVRLAWTTSPQGRKWVNGYYAGWFWETYPPEAVDMSTMTHFVFGRYAPALGSLPGGRAGDLLEGAGGAHAEVENTLIAKAHAAGVKAVMMVGGDSDGPGFVAATANATVRARFIQNILDKAVQKGYDGVDIDWEENLDTPATRAQALALLRELRTASQQRARYQAAPLEISWPGFWVNKNDSDITPWHAEVAAAVDRFNLMTYSMAGDWGWLSWHHSPLFGADTYHPTSIESTVQAYLNAGVPRAKLGIGIGLYGAYYNNPVTGPRQSLDGMQGWMNNGDWENNTQRLVNDNAFGQPGATYHWDDVAKQSYITYSQPWNRGPNTPVTYLSYEDERSIQEKGKWVREQNLGGTLVWTVNYGWLPQQNANPQMQAVKQSFIANAARYRVYRDGTAIATTDDPRYVDAAAPSGSHGYQVSVVDAQGQEGPRSATVTVQVP